MYMSLSIRATGLLAILQRNTSMMLDVANLHTYFTESQQYIEHTLKELVDDNRISIDNNKIEILYTLDTSDPVDRTLEERIQALFSKAPEYGVIAWFLSQLDKTDKTFELDSELMERVQSELDAARVVHFWTPYHRDQALKRALVDKSKGNVTMKDLLDLLEKRDRGEIVWQK
jgi:hypothetical protein